MASDKPPKQVTTNLDKSTTEVDGKRSSSEELVAALQVVASQLRELNGNLRKRRSLRDSNANLQRPSDGELKKLDSSVKRNTALVKKLRQVTDDTKNTLIDDIRRTNQSKYVSEAVAALVEANLKPKDITPAIQVASLLHQRYADFGPDFAAQLSQNLSASSQAASEEERPSMPKRRAWLRLLGEIQALGIAGESKVLLRVLQNLASVDQDREREGAHAALTIFAAFAKAAREEYLGLPPHLPPVPVVNDSEEGDDLTKEALDEVHRLQEVNRFEQSKRFMVPEAEQLEFRKVTQQAFEAACKAMQREHAALVELEQHNLRALNSRGELPEEMADRYEAQRKVFENVQKAGAQLAEASDQKLPVLESGVTTRMKAEGLGVTVLSGKEHSGETGPFDDEETRAFYESLPDVRALVPAVLLSKGQESKQEVPLSSPAEPHSPKEDPATSREQGHTAAAEASVTREEKQDGNVVQERSAEGQDSADPSNLEVRAEVEAAIGQILRCMSRDSADEAAVAFCYVNSKGARKRLVRVLLTSTQIALHQLPFYARVTATLAQVFPDISSQFLASLEDEFAKLSAKRDTTQRTLEARLRNGRFLAELTKFRICPFGTFFMMLKSLLDDFTGHNIDTAATMVDTAGRFLYLVPETHQRMANMLEVMMKLKNSRNVDSRQSLAVDSAYLACKPPERATLRRRRRPPHELYMKHLIHACLTQNTVKQVVRKLRRFPWAENENFLVRCLLSAVKGCYFQTPVLASLAASLSKYHPTLGIALTDALLEEIRNALETPEAGKYQLRVGHVKLLAELYNYRLIDSRTIFDTLYLFLSSGHLTPEDSEKYDPPSSYFRIRLVCVMLASCGQYFSKGSAGQKLDKFLLYFQRYMLYKPPLPLDVEFDVQELLEHLRPRLQRFETFEDACLAAEEMEAKEAVRSAQGEPTPEESESEDEAAVGSGSDDEGVRGQVEEADDAVEADRQHVYHDEDEEVKLLQPLEIAPQEVDEDFERELAGLTLQASAPAGPPYSSYNEGNGLPQLGFGYNGPADASSTVAFKVVMRKAGREDKTRAIQVPASLALAVKSKEDVAADAAERAEMKRLVLEASQREEGNNMEGYGGQLSKSTSSKSQAGARHSPSHYARGGTAHHGRGAAESAGQRGGRSLRGRGRRYQSSSLPPVEELS